MSRSLRLEPSHPGADITVRRPAGLARRLFFHAYSGPVMVGYAYLSSRGTARGKPAKAQRVTRLPTQAREEQAPGGISYCLKVIEVNQNYRQRGIGSVLLEEVIGFCREQQVRSLHGEAKGERDRLRRWYAGRGFEVSSSDDISLTLG